MGHLQVRSVSFSNVSLFAMGTTADGIGRVSALTSISGSAFSAVLPMLAGRHGLRSLRGSRGLHWRLSDEVG